VRVCCRGYKCIKRGYVKSLIDTRVSFSVSWRVLLVNVYNEDGDCNAGEFSSHKVFTRIPIVTLLLPVTST